MSQVEELTKVDPRTTTNYKAMIMTRNELMLNLQYAVPREDLKDFVDKLVLSIPFSLPEMDTVGLADFIVPYTQSVTNVIKTLLNDDFALDAIILMGPQFSVEM